MARIPRYLLDGPFHHITVRGTGGIYLFTDGADRDHWTPVAGRSLVCFRVVCHAWCAMGTHAHLLVESPIERVSRAMHRLNTLYAMYFNDRHDRRGRLFENRFSSWSIRDEDHLHAACMYILQNPVRARLCQTPDQWRWSGLGPPR